MRNPAPAVILAALAFAGLGSCVSYEVEDTLDTAIFFDDIERVHELVEAGVDLNAPLENGGQPLHYALRCDHPTEGIRFLLENGADPSVVEPSTGQTALLYALEYPLETIGLIFEQGGGFPPDDFQLDRLKADVVDAAFDREEPDLLRLFAEHGFPFAGIFPRTHDIDHFSMESATDREIVTLCLGELGMPVGNGAHRTIFRLDEKEKQRFLVSFLDPDDPEVLRDAIHEEADGPVNQLLEMGAVPSDRVMHDIFYHGTGRYRRYFDVVKSSMVSFPQDIFVDHCGENYHATIALLEDMLALGAVINEPDSRGVLPLGEAYTQRVGVPIRTFLVERGADPSLVEVPYHGFVLRPLLYEMTSGQERVTGRDARLRLLIDRSEVNQRHPETGMTPMHYAVRQHRPPQVLEQLIAAGANLDLTDNEGRTPFRAAVDVFNLDAQIVISEHTLDRPEAFSYDLYFNLVWQAMLDEDLEMLDKYIAVGLDVNAVHPDGKPLIRQAAYTGSPAVLRYLLERGADPNATDASGGTALFLPPYGDIVTLSEILLRAGADPNVRNVEGDIPVMEALRYHPYYYPVEYADLLRLHIDFGADIDARDAGGNSLLAIAIAAGHTNCPAILVEAGALVDVPNEAGWTPRPQTSPPGLIRTREERELNCNEALDWAVYRLDLPRVRQ